MSVVAALYIGSFLQPTQVELKTTTLNNKASDCSDCIPNIDSSSQSKTKNDSKKNQQKQKVFIGEVAEQLQMTLNEDYYNRYDNYKKIGHIWDKIKLLTEDELYSLYKHLNESSDNGVNRNIANMIYSRLADIDPVRALNHIYDNKKHHAMYGVMNHWCRKDPFAAFKWTINNEDQIPANYNFEHIIFENMAQMDTAKAIESLESLDSAKRYNALNGILKTVKSSDEFQTIASIINLKGGCDKQVEVVFYNWARKAPKDALDWLGNILDDNQRCKAEKKIKQGWMRTNPSAASEWIMANAQDKPRAMQEIVHGWGWKDGQKAFNFVENQKIDDKDKAYEALVSRYSWNDSDIAIKALDKICDDEKRKKSIYKIYHSLKHKKRDRATEFLNSRTELSATEKEKLVAKKH